MSLGRGHAAAANKQKSRGFSKKQFPNFTQRGGELLSRAGRSSELLAAASWVWKWDLSKPWDAEWVKVLLCGGHETQMSLEFRGGPSVCGNKNLLSLLSLFYQICNPTWLGLRRGLCTAWRGWIIPQAWGSALATI